MKKILYIVGLILIPAFVFAQGEVQQNDSSSDEGSSNTSPTAAPQALLEPATNIVVGVTGSATSNLIVTAKRSGTSRILGGVKLTVTNGTLTKEFSLSDPPNPDGQTAFQATPGKYKLTATRNGYKPLENKEFEIKEKQDLKLSIDLEAISGIPKPEQDYQMMIFAAMLSQLNQQSGTNQGGYVNPLTGQWMPSTTNQGGYINPQTGQWTPTSSTQGGYINPQTGQWVPTNTQGGYINPQTGQWTPVYSPTASQNGYILNNDQTAIIPVSVKINQASYLSMINSVSIIDPYSNNTVNLISSTQYPYNTMNSILPLMNTSIIRSGCLRPNAQYILRVSNNQTTNGQQPYNDFSFTSGTLGSYTNIVVDPPLSVSFGATSFVNAQIQNIPYQANNFSNPTINCPSNLQNGVYNPATQSTYNPQGQVVYNPNTQTYTTVGTTPAYATTTWGDQTIVPTNFGNYNLQKNALGTYYLVSNLDPRDVRTVKFVQNETASGGLVFIPAESGTNSYSSQWYITTYAQDYTPALQSCKSYLEKFITDNSSLSKQVSAANIDYIRGWIASYKTDMDQKTFIMSGYFHCKTKTSELVQGLAAVNITYPPFSITEPSPTLNMSKFSRVSFTPEEYQRAISGQIYTSFNGTP